MRLTLVTLIRRSLTPALPPFARRPSSVGLKGYRRKVQILIQHLFAAVVVCLVEGVHCGHKGCQEGDCLFPRAPAGCARDATPMNLPWA